MKFNGLTDQEVELSRKQHGTNTIPDSEPTTFWKEFKETFGDPMIRILLVISAIMIVMWIFGYAEIYEPLGTIIAVLIVAFVSAKTGVAPQYKAQLALAANVIGVVITSSPGPMPAAIHAQ